MAESRNHLFASSTDVQAFAESVAVALGKGWAVDGAKIEYGQARAELRHAAAYGVISLYAASGVDKLSVSGVFPHHPEVRRPEGSYSIGVNPARGGEAVAREIKRRLLDDYVKAREAFLVDVQRYAADAVITERIAKRLAMLSGGRLAHQSEREAGQRRELSVWAPGSVPTFRVATYSGSVSVSFEKPLSVNEVCAAKLIEVFRTNDRAKEDLKAREAAGEQ